MEYPQAGYSSHDAPHRLSRPTSFYSEYKHLPPLPPPRFTVSNLFAALQLPMMPYSEYSTLDLKGNAASLKETYAQVKSSRERLITAFPGVRTLSPSNVSLDLKVYEAPPV